MIYLFLQDVKFLQRCCWVVKSSGMWCCVVGCVAQGISKAYSGTVIFWNTRNLSPRSKASYPRRHELSYPFCIPPSISPCERTPIFYLCIR